MEHEHEIRHRLADLEGALQDIAPVPARLDPARTLFLAGQQSMRKQQRWQAFWPLSSACLAVVCIAMGIRLAQPGETRIVYVPAETSAEQSDGQSTGPKEKVPPTATFDQQLRPNQTELALASPSNAALQNLIDRRRWQAQILKDSLDESTADTATGEPAVIEAVNSRDWHLMLTDQSPGERFRMRAEPFRRSSTPAIQYWTSLFPTRGS